MISQHLFSIEDRAQWQSYLPASANVFGSVEFAAIQQHFSGFEVRLFVTSLAEGTVVYPFVLRPVAALPVGSVLLEPYWDTVTPEYTGPIVFGNDAATLPMTFFERYSALCQEQHIVAEFAHLHPWLWQPGTLDAALVKFDREIVYVDLTLSEKELWENSFTQACRKNIKRNQRDNVRVIPATTPDDIREFHRLYIQTMDRNHALERYYFPLDYFLAFFEQMTANARFVLAIYEDRVIAGTLYLHDEANVYSYLGGADHAFQQVRPTNAMVYDTILWGKSRGKVRLILGGGYQPNDGIFRFKASFSPLRARFHTYKRIHIPQIYALLCNEWTRRNGTEAQDAYFPAYRAGPAMLRATDDSSEM